MAISFNKLKDPKLGLLDKITFGKLKDCRVCDVVQDHYEYLIWCEKQGFVKFSKEVEILICETASFEKWAPPETELTETDTYLKSKMPGSYVFDDSWDDDIPF